MQLLSATGPKDSVYALLRQLRPAYSQKTMSEQINKQQSQGYQLAYVEPRAQGSEWKALLRRCSC